MLWSMHFCNAILLLLQSIVNVFKNIEKCLFSCTSDCVAHFHNSSPEACIFSFPAALDTQTHTHTLRFVLLAQSDSRKGGINQLDMTWYPASNQKKSTCHYSLNIVTVNMLLQFNFSFFIRNAAKKAFAFETCQHYKSPLWIYSRSEVMLKWDSCLCCLE